MSVVVPWSSARRYNAGCRPQALAPKTLRSDFFIKSNALRRTYEMKYRGAAGSINADPLAVALAAEGTLGQKYMSVAMKVEFEGEYTRGLLVCGEDKYSGNPVPPGNVDICIVADHERFRQMVFRTLRSE